MPAGELFETGAGEGVQAFPANSAESYEGNLGANMNIVCVCEEREIPSPYIAQRPNYDTYHMGPSLPYNPLDQQVSMIA